MDPVSVNYKGIFMTQATVTIYSSRLPRLTISVNTLVQFHRQRAFLGRCRDDGRLGQTLGGEIFVLEVSHEVGNLSAIGMNKRVHCLPMIVVLHTISIPRK